jgi:hypothetical protein
MLRDYYRQRAAEPEISRRSCSVNLAAAARDGHSNQQ